MIPGDKHGTCKLCCEDAQLCESHIVPEFCYKRIYDDKHQVIEGRFTNNGLHKRVIQKGKREYLLCSRCEGILNNYEKRFSEYWYGPNGLPDRVNGDHLVLRDADYHIFKLFHLSVIWRISVSTSFSSITLGPYNDALRRILFNDNSVPQNHYPIIGCVMTDDDGRIVHHEVSAPLMGHHDGSRRYTLRYAGCEWMIIITDHPTRTQMHLSDAISTDGTITLLAMHFAKAHVGQAVINALRRAGKGTT